METYIIRVYRFQKGNPRQLVGIVEAVEDERRGKRAFTGLDDLWDILSARRPEGSSGLSRSGRKPDGVEATASEPVAEK